MERWVGRVALVTGASSGIGAAVALELVRQGMVVVGCARNLERLKTIDAATEKPGRFHAYQCDVSNESDIESIFKWIREKLGGTDVLINNAGLSHQCSILEGQMSDWRNILEVNVLALAKCSQEAYKCMKGRGVDDGHIINVNSLLGHTITSDYMHLNMYGASKHAVGAITKAIRLELRAAESRIRVTSITPGAVETRFASNMLGAEVSMEDLLQCKLSLSNPLRPGENEDVVGAAPTGDDPTSSERTTILLPTKIMSGDDIAKAFVHVLSLPPHVQVDELTVRPVETLSP